ncbi:MAG: hypothetical protein JKY71_00150 [Alphaproteobacteria bacterium]|nr:hypothetical protein [Alphaproteobacteria bacterium]
MIWILFALQAALILLSGWVYQSYILKPKTDHPPIFWNPMARFALVTGVPFTLFGNIVLAFVFTLHPWWFLIFTILGFIVVVGSKQK